MSNNLYKEILNHTPNHYQLLGLKLFESDPEKIKQAGMGQTKKIKDWALLPDRTTAEEVQKIRKLVDIAITVLEDKVKKEKYDQELGEELGIAPKKKKSDLFSSDKKPSLILRQITCPQCGTINKPGIKKCTECEKYLLQNCKNCQRETPIDKKHCFYCKTLISKSPRKKINKKKADDEKLREKTSIAASTPEVHFLRKNLLKIGVFLLIIFVSCLFIFFLVNGILNVFKIHDKNREIKTKTEMAEKLGIPMEVKKPTLSLTELEKLANNPSSEIYKSWEQKIPGFDDKAAETEICNELGISLAMKKEPKLTIPQIKEKAQKLIAKNIEVAINQKTSAFDELAVRNAIIKDCGLEKPIKEPKITPEELKKELLRESAKKAAEKYPSSLLLKKEKNIGKKYITYKEGDKVTIIERNGLRYTGIYRGRTGSRIRIGSKTLRFLDLPISQQVKFNKSLAARKEKYEIQRAKFKFSQKRKKYEKKYFDDNKAKVLYENGYVKVKDGWTTAPKLIQAKLKEAETAHKETQKVISDNIKMAISDSFDHDKFIKEHGYIKLNDKWYTEDQAFGLLLDEKMDAYVKTKKQKLDKFKNQFFRKNGYIMTKNGWQAASDLLEKETQKSLASNKKIPEAELTTAKLPKQKTGPNNLDTPPQVEAIPEKAGKNEKQEETTLTSPTVPNNANNFLNITEAQEVAKKYKPLIYDTSKGTGIMLQLANASFKPMKKMFSLTDMQLLSVGMSIPMVTLSKDLKKHDSIKEKSLEAIFKNIDNNKIKQVLKLVEKEKPSIEEEVAAYYTLSAPGGQFVNEAGKFNSPAFSDALHNLTPGKVSKTAKLLATEKWNTIATLMRASGMCINQAGSFDKGKFEALLGAISQEIITAIPIENKSTVFLILFLTAKTQPGQKLAPSPKNVTFPSYSYSFTIPNGWRIISSQLKGKNAFCYLQRESSNPIKKTICIFANEEFVIKAPPKGNIRGGTDIAAAGEAMQIASATTLGLKNQNTIKFSGRVNISSTGIFTHMLSGQGIWAFAALDDNREKGLIIFSASGPDGSWEGVRKELFKIIYPASQKLAKEVAPNEKALKNFDKWVNKKYAPPKK